MIAAESAPVSSGSIGTGKEGLVCNRVLSVCRACGSDSPVIAGWLTNRSLARRIRQSVERMSRATVRRSRRALVRAPAPSVLSRKKLYKK